MALVDRIYPAAKPLQQLLMEIVEPTGAGEALQARLHYVQDIPGYADLCTLLRTATGVLNEDAPRLPAGTLLEQHLTQTDVSIRCRT